MAALHLIHGFTGAGKTTFAKKLERDSGAVRFSQDEWMVRLYGIDLVAAHLFADRYRRIQEVIWEMTALFLARGHDVILDWGFWSRSERDIARKFAGEQNAEARLYTLICPEDVMRKRVLERTACLPFGDLPIDENAFELFKSRFEPLCPDEDGITIDGASLRDGARCHHGAS